MIHAISQGQIAELCLTPDRGRSSSALNCCDLLLLLTKIVEKKRGKRKVETDIDIERAGKKERN